MDDARPSVMELEHALRGLAREIAYPVTPSLVPAVRSRLAADRVQQLRPPFPGRALWSRRRILVLAVLGLLVLAGAAVAARLAIGAIQVRIVPSLSTTSPTFETRPNLGGAIPLQQARSAVSFPIGLPSALPPPDRVSLAESYVGDRVVLAWRPQVGLSRIEPTPWGAVLMEFVGFAGTKEVAVKEVPEGHVEYLQLPSGDAALWITGPHDLVLRTAAGERRFRITGNVLIWEGGGGVTYRLETTLSRPDALRLASSVG